MVSNEALLELIAAWDAAGQAAHGKNHPEVGSALIGCAQALQALVDA